MFHQVFICGATEDQDCSGDLIPEHNNEYKTSEIVKEENTSESTTMGFVQMEDVKIAIKELKSEHHSAINNHILMKTDITQVPHLASLETKDIINAIPFSDPVLPNSQTGQEFILPVTDEQVLQPLSKDSPAEMVIQQDAVVFQAYDSALIYHQPPDEKIVPQPQPALVSLNGDPVQLSAPTVAVQAGAVATQEINIGPSLKIEPTTSVRTEDLSEELKVGKFDVADSEVKIDGEDLPMECDSSEDTETQNGQLKFQGNIRINNTTICHRLVMKKEELTESQSIGKCLINSQKNQSVEKVNTKQKEPKKIYAVKDRVLVINDSYEEYITPELFAEHQMKNSDKLSLNKHQGSVVRSESEEEDFSDDEDSGSDWEEEHFGTNFKRKEEDRNSPSNSKSSSSSTDFNTKEIIPNTKPRNKDIENSSCPIQTPIKTKNQKISNKNIKYNLKLTRSATKTTFVLSKPLAHRKSESNGGDKVNLKTSMKPNNNKTITISHEAKGNSEKDDKLNFRKILPKPCASSYTFGVIKKTTSNTKCSSTVNVPNGHSNIQETSAEQNLSSGLYLIHCKECDKLFGALEQFLDHKKAFLCFKKSKEVSYKCDICGKVLANDETLRDHKNWHTNARPFKCSHCDERFNGKKARYRHYKMKHSKDSKNFRHMCSYCGYSNTKLKYLLAHEEVHRLPEGAEIPKPFECTECGKKFRFDSNLRNHLKFHSSASFFCGICDKGFKSKGNLTQHIVTHSDYRPLTCLLCGDKFKRVTHLKQHKLAVHGEGRNQ